MGKRTIYDWVAITKNEKSGWSEFYRELLGQPLSDTARFLKAVGDFGHQIMFDALLSSSTRKLTGDPLNYVIATAVAMAQERALESSKEKAYQMGLDKAKQRILMQNEELEAKIERARKASEQSGNS